MKTLSHSPHVPLSFLFLIQSLLSATAIWLIQFPDWLCVTISLKPPSFLGE